jgi:hypothetical protein
VVKNAVYWDVTPFGSCEDRNFGGTPRHHHQGDKIGELRPMVTVTWKRITLRASVTSYCYRCSQLDGSFHRDDGGDTCLRNVGTYKDHTA